MQTTGKAAAFLRAVRFEDFDKEKAKADIAAMIRAMGKLAGTLGKSEREIIDEIRAAEFERRYGKFSAKIVGGATRAAGRLMGWIRAMLIGALGALFGVWLGQRSAAHDVIVEVPLKYMDHAREYLQAWLSH